MDDDYHYELVGETDYKRTITALEIQIARLKRELLPAKPVSPTERQKQHAIWLELDRISTYLAQIREQAPYLITHT